MIRHTLSKELNVLQMEQVKLGIEHGVDASVYGSINYSWEQMSAIRHLMEDGLDPSKLLNPNLTESEYKRLALETELEHGELHLSPEEVQGYLNELK